MEARAPWRVGVFQHGRKDMGICGLKRFFLDVERFLQLVNGYVKFNVFVQVCFKTLICVRSVFFFAGVALPGRQALGI